MIQMANNNLEKLNATLKTTIDEKNTLENNYVELEKEIPTGINQQISFTELNIKKLETDLNNLNIGLGKLNQLELDKQEKENDLKDKKKELKNFKKYAYIYEILTKKYKDFARQKFEDSIVSIQNVANGIIHQIMPEMSVKIYEDDSKLKKVTISFEINKRDRSYKRLSGGQRTIANIALRLGFSKIVQARAKSNIGFVVLDEPFGSLDEKNRELVSRMLTVMLEWFEQILVISHVDNIKDFPNVINVGMTPEGVSYIK
jgi:DNA repair exonuclease SbcCD ATPase subunit